MIHLILASPFPPSIWLPSRPAHTHCTWYNGPSDLAVVYYPSMTSTPSYLGMEPPTRVCTAQELHAPLRFAPPAPRCPHLGLQWPRGLAPLLRLRRCKQRVLLLLGFGQARRCLLQQRQLPVRLRLRGRQQRPTMLVCIGACVHA